MKPEINYYLNGNQETTQLGGQPTITILEGKALEQLRPNTIIIEGDIRTVSEFLSKRDNSDDTKTGYSTQKLDTNKAIVYVDYLYRTILLELDPENPLGAKVKATLSLDEEFLTFAINTQKTWSRQEFEKLIRFSRLYFLRPEQHKQLVEELQRFKASTKDEIEQARDNRSNLTNNRTKEVTATLMQGFELTVPIFKGFAPENIKVDICFDVVNGAVAFWLESVGAVEIVQAQTEKIIKAELEKFPGLVTINR